MNHQRAADEQRHDRTLELAATALDFALTSRELRDLDAHLAKCPTCARRVAGMREDARVLARPLSLLPSARVDVTVMAAIGRRPTRPQGMFLFAAAALVLVGLLGSIAVGAALLRMQSSPSVVVPDPPEPVVQGSPSPDRPPFVVGDTWEPLELPAYVPGVLIEAATFVASDLVGVGRAGCVPDLNSPTSCYGSVWTATAGQGLEQVVNQPGLKLGTTVLSKGPPKGIHDVAGGPAGIVAIGYPYDGLGPGVWHSRDGRTWQRVGLGSEAVDVNVHAISAGSKGYVIVGTDVDFGVPAARAAAWISSNGIDWTRANDNSDMDVGACLETGEEPACGGMMSVTEAGSGYVAVGQARSDRGERVRPAAWTSRDGLDWVRSEIGLDFDGFLSGITLGGPGLVAVGTICEPTCLDAAPGVAATSLDGSIWTFMPVTGATELQGVTSIGGGRQVFALGAPGLVAEPPAELQVWQSADGAVWQRMTGPPSIPAAVGFGGADIAGADDRLVIVGWAEVTGAEGVQNFAYISPADPPDAPVASAVAGPPRPLCPAPQRQLAPPVVSAAAGNGQVVEATPGSYTTVTCSTTSTADAPLKPPGESLAAYPGETIELTVPVGWYFARWEGSHEPRRGDGGGSWPRIQLLDKPRSIALSGPLLTDEIVSLTVVLVSDDERTVIELGLQLLVNQAVS